MKTASSWRKLAWRSVDNPFITHVVDQLYAKNVEAREIITQDIGKYRNFIDDQVGWGVCFFISSSVLS